MILIIAQSIRKFLKSYKERIKSLEKNNKRKNIDLNKKKKKIKT